MKKWFQGLAVASMTFLLAGCFTTTTTWVKPGVTPIQSAKDLKVCSEKAGLYFNLTGYNDGPVGYVSQDSYKNFAGEPFEKCMKEKGYRKEK